MRRIDDVLLAGKIAELSRETSEDDYFKLSLKCQEFLERWAGPFSENGLSLVTWTTNCVFTVKKLNEPLLYLTFSAIEQGHGDQLAQDALSQLLPSHN